jgi:NRE family putative nickel resistance protein-like MFS transporter
VIGHALMLRIAAFLLVSQFAGIGADRALRKVILVAADVSRLVLMAIFLLVTAVWQLYLLVFLVNALTAFFTPSFEASIPDVVVGSGYVRALALSRAASAEEAVASPAAAALVVALARPRWVFWIDAATYLVSALLVLASSVPVGSGTGTIASWRDLLSEIGTGTRLLLREPSLRQA